MESGTKWFSCKQCYYKCKQQSDLIKHKLEHPTQKLFSCNACNYTSPWSTYLDSHISTYHSVQKRQTQTSYRPPIRQHTVTAKNIQPVTSSVQRNTCSTSGYAHINNNGIQQRNVFDEVMKDIENLFGKRDTDNESQPFRNPTNGATSQRGTNISSAVQGIEKEAKQLDYDDMLVDVMNIKTEAEEYTPLQIFLEADVDGEVDIEISKLNKAIDGFVEVKKEAECLFDNGYNKSNTSRKGYHKKINKNKRSALDSQITGVKLECRTDFEEVIENTESLLVKRDGDKNTRVLRSYGNKKYENHRKTPKYTTQLVSCNAQGSGRVLKKSDCHDDTVISEMNVKMEVEDHEVQQNVVEISIEKERNIDISNIKLEIEVEPDLGIDDIDGNEFADVDVKVGIDDNAVVGDHASEEIVDHCTCSGEANDDTKSITMCKNINGNTIKYNRCTICMCIFTCSTAYDEHIKMCRHEDVPNDLDRLIDLEMLPQKLYQCHFCPLEFVSYHKFIRHRRVHPEKFSCDICSQKFVYMENLTQHKEFCVKPKPLLECTLCDFKSISKRSMEFHMGWHRGRKCLTCDICKFKCLREVSMVYHKMQHKGILPFCCDKCSYRCSSTYLLSKHKMSHRNAIFCKVCGAKFKSMRYLNKHLLTHEKEQPFVCEVCNVPFKTKQYLKYHSNIHNDIMRFCCKICDFKCKRRSQLNEHMATHHDKTVFTCDVCKVVYKSTKFLKIHMLCHNNPLDKPVRRRRNKVQ